MGSRLQKILPGRGDKKGTGVRLKVAAVSLLVTAWAGLLLDYAVRFPRFWFSFAAATLIFCGVQHLFSKRREYALEFLFSILLLYAGIVANFSFPWLKLAYFPFIITMTRFYSLNIIVPLSVLVPFNELRTFVITRENVTSELAFSLFLVLTSVVASFIFSRLRSEKAEVSEELEKIKAKARDRTLDTEMESLGSDEIISHYFASRIRTDEEIGELLGIMKHAAFADAAHFFEPQGDAFSLRCSTGGKGKVMITGKGIIAACLRERKPFISGEIDEKNTEVGYIAGTGVLSLIAQPVMEGSTPVGLLAVDSSRYHAFNEPELKTVRMISTQIARILERERIYTVLKYDFTTLRIIKEFSSGLAASIQYDVVIQKLCDYAGQAFAGDIFFFERDSHGFQIRHFPREITGNSEQIDFTGTLIGHAIENRHKEYVSDIRQLSLRILPQNFPSEGYRSVIAVPLYYEDSLLGVFGILSLQKEFLDSRRISLIELMCNQASTSIANAKMHGEIERLATTDGLTGLFNHRVFQQKLAGEIRRSERYATPLSLLLADIDYFKQVNDTYGHPAGDLVLKRVAGILKEQVRDIDIAARYGGEEFAVILPGTDGLGARNIAERLRQTVMAETFEVDNRSLKLTVSIGIATMPADAGTKEELIEKTDEALYRAKRHGRNQTVNWAGHR